MEMENDARLCPLPPSAIIFQKFFFFFRETTKSKDAEIACMHRRSLYDDRTGTVSALWSIVVSDDY